MVEKKLTIPQMLRELKEFCDAKKTAFSVSYQEKEWVVRLEGICVIRDETLKDALYWTWMHVVNNTKDPERDFNYGTGVGK